MLKTLLAIAMAVALFGGFVGLEKPVRRVRSGPPPAHSLRFAVVGDTGTGAPKEYLVASAIDRTCADRGCDFLVLLGDNVYPDGVTSVDDPQWEEKVRAPYLSMGYRVRAVLGGHDYGDDFPDLTRANAQLAYSAVDPLWEMPARFHGSAEGPALLLFLDTSPFGHGTGTYAAEQAAYVRSMAESATSPWRIAFGHDPYLSNGSEHGSATGDRAAFLTDVLCPDVDLYFAGHDHHREVFEKPDGCPVTQVISGAGAKTSPVVDELPSLFKSPTLGFAYVTVDPGLLTVDMVDAEGRTDFTLSLAR